jgi:hypothetical protein
VRFGQPAQKNLPRSVNQKSTQSVHPRKVAQQRTRHRLEAPMGKKVSQLLPRSPRLAGASLLAVPALIAAGIGVAGPASGSTAPAAAHGVTQVNLVSDQAGKAQFMDPKLINPWGLAQSPTSPLWSANNGTNSATLYSGGVAGSPVVKPPLEVDVAGGPTGQVFNDTTKFVVSSTAGSGAAPFIFDTEAGDIKAWNPAAAPTTALTVAHSGRPVPAGRRLPQRPDRRVQPEVPPGAAPSPVLHRPTAAARLRTVQRRGPEQLDLRQLRQAGRHAA